MKPTIQELPETFVIGMGARFISIMSPDADNSKVIPALWHQFVNRIDEIPGRVGHASYGLVGELPPAQRTGAKGELFYVACVTVRADAQPPAGMIRQAIPAGKYAVFTHHGKLDTLGKTMHDIYAVWLPQSGMQRRHAPDIEVYDQRFKLDSDDSEFDICLPVK